MQPALIDDMAEPLATSLPVVLWHRAGRGEPWEMLGTYATEREAFAAIDRGGDWVVLPAEREP